jgi:ADP-dependent NAD(P)H-hydrate dehydratase
MTIPPLDASPLPRLEPRAADGHKGDFGRALLVGGSLGMAGAIGLAGMATLRAGAGLVRLAVPEPILATVSAFEPSYMTLPLPADGHGRIASAAREDIVEAAANATCVACGPGLGRSTELTELVGWMYSNLRCPMVVDADALNALAAHPAVLEHPGGPRVLTPHPGEFARLLGGVDVPNDERQSRLLQFTERVQAVVILKGHRTLISDGQRMAVNTTGNPGMATGGTGDVLTGIVTALLCQGLAPYDAARLAAHIHGLSGDLAAKNLGQVGMIARDLVIFLPTAFLLHEAASASS